jgi:tRNA(Ile)-lysidine synthase
MEGWTMDDRPAEDRGRETGEITLNQIRNILYTQCRLLPRDRLVVGVSGGPDSLCLLDALHRLGVPVVVAHLNHGLREEASADARWVQAMAESRGLPFELEEQDVAGYADQHGLSVEEAARTLRYRFLFAKAGEYKAQAAAVGHSADDQAETVLMHMLRGAGLSGLRGMQFRAVPNAWSETVPLVRPLLGIWRGDILDYLSDRELDPVLDRTNLDVTIFRNRLRHELIPYLEGYNPAIRQLLWRMAQVLSGDYEVLEAVIEEAWGDCLRLENSGYVALDLEALIGKPTGLQRHVMRRAIAALRPGLRDIDFESVARALDFVKDPPQSRQQDLTAGLRLLLEEDRVWVATWEGDLPGGSWPQLPDESVRRLEVPGDMSLQDGWRLKAGAVEDSMAIRDEALTNADPYQAWLDADKLPDSLTLRPRQPGDRFQPLGMEDHRIKLADFMVNAKLPRRARRLWPIVCAGEQIVWVPGFQIAHAYRLTAVTSRVVHLKVLRGANSWEE